MSKIITRCFCAVLILCFTGIIFVPSVIFLNKSGNYNVGILSSVISVSMVLVSVTIIGLTAYIKLKIEESQNAAILVHATQLIQIALYMALSLFEILNMKDHDYDSWLIDVILSGLVSCIALFDIILTWKYIYLPYTQELKSTENIRVLVKPGKKKFVELKNISNVESDFNISMGQSCEKEIVGQPCEKEIVGQPCEKDIVEQNNTTESKVLSELKNLSGLILYDQMSESARYYKNTSLYSFEDNLLPQFK
jgi:hypothetical protein